MKERVSKLPYSTLQHWLRMLYTTKLVTGNRTENQFHLSCTKQFWPKFERDINCSFKRSNQLFLSKSYYLHIKYVINKKNSRNSVSAVSVELQWRTVLSNIFNSKFKKGVTPREKNESEFPVDMHIYTLSPS